MTSFTDLQEIIRSKTVKSFHVINSLKKTECIFNSIRVKTLHLRAAGFRKVVIIQRRRITVTVNTSLKNTPARQ